MMDQNIRVLVVDDNRQLREMVEETVDSYDGLEVVGVAEDGMQAIEMTTLLRPDVMLLDMVMPRMDGFGVLERFHNGSYPYVPAVVCLTALGDEAMIRRALELGASYYMVKPVDQQMLCKRITENMSPVQARPKAVAATNNPLSSSSTRSLDERISAIFLTIGIPAHIKGYQYLREAVKMVVEEQTLINRITKELYPGIGRHFDTTASKVERAIRHAIEVAWTRGKIENINQVFGHNIYTRNDKPTNGEFIALVADKLQMERNA
jgi:two-component system response regulator (stage 0 sporulation protein A)